MPNEPTPPVGVVFIRDMIFESKISATARSLGVELSVVRQANDLPAVLERHGPGLMIVDLGCPDALEAIAVAAAHSPRPRILAYVSHVEVELANAAAEKGADEVLPRSRFVNELPRLLGDCPGAP